MFDQYRLYINVSVRYFVESKDEYERLVVQSIENGDSDVNRNDNDNNASFFGKILIENTILNQ